MRLEKVSSAAQLMLTQPGPYQFQPTSTACFQQMPTKTSFDSKVFGKRGNHPVHQFSGSLHKPSYKLPIKKAPISQLRKKGSNLLVSVNAMAGVVNVLFSQLPIFNRPFHEAGDHDEAKDEDVDAGEHFVHQGRFLHTKNQKPWGNNGREAVGYFPTSSRCWGLQGGPAVVMLCSAHLTTLHFFTKPSSSGKPGLTHPEGGQGLQLRHYYCGMWHLPTQHVHLARAPGKVRR